MEVFMRSRSVLLTLSLYLTFAVLGCTSKPPADTSTDTTANPSETTAKGGKEAKEAREAREAKEARKEKKKEPVIVPAGTSVTVSLGSALGSKLSQAGQTFTGTVAKDVTVGNEVVIPKGSTVAGTVTDAKALGKFKGGAVLDIRLDSINLNGYDMPVQTAARSFTEKGKGKRTAVLTGGGAALGGIVGALAGGGKGAAIGAAAGAGAGAGGSAFTGNKEIVLPAESDVTFDLTQELKLERM
jgi:hypothetical protein